MGFRSPVQLRGNLQERNRRPIAKYMDSVMGCAKTAEPIEMPFGIPTRLGPKKHVLDGIHIGATWRILLNRPCAAAIRPCINYFDHLLCYGV